jgi:hypothetical protein
MKSILNMLKPNTLTGLLLVVILLVQGTCFTSSTMTYSMGSDTPEKTQSSFGVGSPITVTTISGSTSRVINWSILMANLALSYVIAVVLTSGFTRATRFRRPTMAYGAAALVMVIVSFIVSVSMSRSYRGTSSLGLLSCTRSSKWNQFPPSFPSQQKLLMTAAAG